MKTKGFTLIELVIVMVILAILVTLGVPKLLGQSDKAQKTKLISDGRVLEDAINRYYIDEGDWPRLTPEGEPLTETELTSKIYALNDKGFDSPFTPEEGANYYDINLEALEPYIKSFNSDIKHFVLQNPVGSVYIQDPKENTRLTSTAPFGENQKPVASFTMTPEEGITTTTEIVFTSTSTDPDGDALTPEWTGKQDVYSEEGVYTVTLRVQDEHGLWSEMVSKTFTVINAAGVKQIAAGTSHTVVLMDDGTVKAFGSNACGQLGIAANSGTSNPNPVPTAIPGLTGVKQVTAGDQHSLALMDDGTVKAFGYNHYGQLGIAENSHTMNPNPVPTTIPGLSGVKQIASGYFSSFALMEDGTVMSFGRNRYGELGVSANSGTNNANPTPSKIPGLTGAKAVRGGGLHTLVIMNDNTVKAFGYNKYGQLGFSANNGTEYPFQYPTTIPNLSGVMDISAGYYHTIALMIDGTVKTFGYNRYGQLGNTKNVNTTSPNLTPTTIPNISNAIGVAAGYDHSLVQMSDGTVRAFGFNSYGQIGKGANSIPNASPSNIAELFGVGQIAAGAHHSLVMLQDGTVKGFGHNYRGQLGATVNNGTNNPNHIPVIVRGL